MAFLSFLTHSHSTTNKIAGSTLGTKFVIRLGRYPIFISVCQFSFSFFFPLHCLPINEKFHSRSDKNWRGVGGCLRREFFVQTSRLFWLDSRHSIRSVERKEKRRRSNEIGKRTRHWFLYTFLERHKICLSICLEEIFTSFLKSLQRFFLFLLNVYEWFAKKWLKKGLTNKKFFWEEGKVNENWKEKRKKRFPPYVTK